MDHQSLHHRYSIIAEDCTKSVLGPSEDGYWVRHFFSINQSAILFRRKHNNDHSLNFWLTAAIICSEYLSFHSSGPCVCIFVCVCVLPILGRIHWLLVTVVKVLKVLPHHHFYFSVLPICLFHNFFLIWSITIAYGWAK